MHFSTELQFSKIALYITLYFSVFKNNCCLIIFKIYVVTPNFLWIPDLRSAFPELSHKQHKNTSLLGYNVLKLILLG